MTSTARGQVPLTFIDYRAAGGVATITIERPGSGNALNWALLEQLRTAVRRAINAADVEAIIIGAAGKHFVSGADLSFFVRCLERGDMDRIVACIRAAQEVFAEIAASPKPTVAAVGGAAVGGGVELALACRRIVATPRASFSFPETSLGILPFAGGTYCLPERIGVGLAKWLIYTGHVLLAAKALSIGLIDRLVMPAELPNAAAALARELRAAPTRPSRESALSTALLQTEALFAQSSVDELLAVATQRAPVAGHTAPVAALKGLATRSPTTLRAAESIFHAAIAEDAAHAPQAALGLVPEMFGRAEVHEALAQAARRQQAASDHEVEI